MSENPNFEIALPQYKGPFDLLLFFIQRDELDIYDIPITKITHDFLDYIHQMKQLNIEIASEFILVAATLMKIKAQMLLPTAEKDEDGNAIDPRTELAQKIMEYKQFRELSEKLATLEAEEIVRVRRLSAERELQAIAEVYRTDFEMENLSIAKLTTVFHQLLEKKKFRDNAPTHQINPYHYEIPTEKSWILAQCEGTERISFERIFEEIEYRIHAIFRFLALLELVQEGKMEILTGEKMNNFWVAIRR